LLDYLIEYKNLFPAKPELYRDESCIVAGYDLNGLQGRMQAQAKKSEDTPMVPDTKFA